MRFDVKIPFTPSLPVAFPRIITKSIGFNAQFVTVNNLTAYWLFIQDAEAYVPPFQIGVVKQLIHSSGYAYLEAGKTPDGTQDTPSLTSNYVEAIWTTETLTASDGQSWGASNFSVVPSSASTVVASGVVAALVHNYPMTLPPSTKAILVYGPLDAIYTVYDSSLNYYKPVRELSVDTITSRYVYLVDSSVGPLTITSQGSGGDFYVVASDIVPTKQDIVGPYQWNDNNYGPAATGASITIPDPTGMRQNMVHHLVAWLRSTAATVSAQIVTITYSTSGFAQQYILSIPAVAGTVDRIALTNLAIGGVGDLTINVSAPGAGLFVGVAASGYIITSA